MILISGTKRSGTSMWMQVMQAAGVPILGRAFPRNWGGQLRDANPDGFYESLLRNGIYYRTNPHPQTGKYFMPEHVIGYAVKVFVPGVIRSERAYIEHLIANVREWREYEASINRLYEIETAARESQRAAGAELPPEPFNFPPAYEWWMENFALVRDISLRRYPMRLQTYDQVLEDPERVIGDVLRAIGHGDVEAGAAAVKPGNRTQSRPESDTVEPKLARVFDDLYAAVAEGKGFGPALLRSLNETNQALLVELTKLQHQVAHSQVTRQAKAPKKAPPMAIDGLPEL